MAPLERLKILMQVQGSHKTYTGVWQARAGIVLTAVTAAQRVARVPGAVCRV